MHADLTHKLVKFFRLAFIPWIEDRPEEERTRSLKETVLPVPPMVRYRSGWLNVRRVVERDWEW